MKASRSTVGRSEVSRSTSRRRSRSRLVARLAAATGWNFNPVWACSRSSRSDDRPRCCPWLSTKLNGGKSRSGAYSSTGCLATHSSSSGVSCASGAATAAAGASTAPTAPCDAPRFAGLARPAPIQPMTSRRFKLILLRQEVPSGRGARTRPCPLVSMLRPFHPVILRNNSGGICCIPAKRRDCSGPSCPCGGHRSPRDRAQSARLLSPPTPGPPRCPGGRGRASLDLAEREAGVKALDVGQSKQGFHRPA